MTYQPIPPLGQTTKSGSLPVVIASDQPGIAVQGIRPLSVSASITLGTASYAAGENIGGVITVATGLPANTPVLLDRIAVAIAALNASTTNAAIEAVMLNASPASTIADGVLTNWNTADAAKVAKYITLANSALNQGANTDSLYIFEGSAAGAEATVDSSGNLYFVAVASTTQGWGTSSYAAKLFVGLRY